MSAPDLTHIAKDLHPLAQDIAQYHMDPNNARLHDERSVNSVVASLKEFGQRKPIVVKMPEMIVKAGNGTLEAAKRLGWTHIAVVHIDEESRMADGYALADNRTGELSEWDFEQLVDVLDDLRGADFPLDALGWSSDEVDNLLKADWSPPTADDNDGLPDADDAARSHAIKMSDSEHEILQRAITKMRATSTVGQHATDGFAVSTLAEFWTGRQSTKENE